MLLNWNVCKRVIEGNENLDAWQEYNKRKTISYIWDKTKITTGTAKNKVVQLLWLIE